MDSHAHDVGLPVPQVVRPLPDAHASAAARARRLAHVGIWWHIAEAAVAIAAGIAAGSIALVGFGGDSVIEGFAGAVVIWRLRSSRVNSDAAERRAQRLIAASFVLLVLYITVEAVRTLAGGTHPEVSWIGIGLALSALLVMPPLAAAKARAGRAIGSSATVSEGRQNMLCAYLSAALLVGLGANALFGWWWADPIVALLIGAVALKEARDAWRGDACCATC